MKKKLSLLVAIVTMFLSSNILAKENPNIAKDLMAQYNDTVKSCTGNKPAYQCSGIMIRGINQANKLAHAWSLKPENKQKESFSFAFLRRDQQFSSFPRGYDSGIIMYPQLKTPAGKNRYKVYCAFPVDGGTDSRAGHGCGKYSGDTTGMSEHCYKQGINTFNKWVTHFNKIMNSNDPNFVSKQCAFDMTIASRVNDFDIIRQANQYIQKSSSKYYMRNNELLVHAWNENNPSPLPIQAFFYIIGSSEGLKYAQKYQKDYYNVANKEFVPIVGITLPKTPNDSLTVKYNKNDQAMGGGTTPPATNTIEYTHFFNRVWMNGAFVGFGSALPNNYSFVANKQYKLEITMPAGIELLTCSTGSFLDGVCGATQIREYDYSNGIFTPYKSGVLNGNKLIGNKNFKVRTGTAGVVKFKLTPL